MPVWSCDGKQITYPVLSGAIYYVYQVHADSSSLPQLLLKGAKMIPNDWSPDGHLVFMDFKNGGPPSLSVYSASDHQVSELVASDNLR